MLFSRYVNDDDGHDELMTVMMVMVNQLVMMMTVNQLVMSA